MANHLRKEDRKTILLLCDDIRLHSGIATMARELVIGTAHQYNWVQLGAALHHPDHGKIFDVSADVQKETGVEDASVLILANTGYGEAQTVRSLIKKFNPSGIMIFTDPRYWVWLFNLEREIRNKIPILYLNIWDNYPAPLYNRDFYDSCDLLMGISKQTVNINKLVLGEKADNKVITYVPHGINSKHFYPIKEGDKEFETVEAARKEIFGTDAPEFIVFWNSRNIHRKRPADVILSYKIFCDMIGEEKAKKCALVMHTQAVDENGTDLNKVRDAICSDSTRIFFSQNKLHTAQLNVLYNLADATTLISSNEGWGLSLTESMMAGTMIIPNVTGGMQDQCRFEDAEGNWVDFDDKFPSNHRGTYTKCGEWAEPVFPSNISITGSIPTPYIFDDRCDPEDVAKAILKIYNLPKEERNRRGQAGRDWALSEEANMSASGMCKNLIKSIEECLEKFTPRPRFELIKSETIQKESVKHKVHGY